MIIDSKYARAFGFLESAVHRALRELQHIQESEATMGMGDIEHLMEADDILRDALHDLQFNHGIELQWPDDVRRCSDPGCKYPATIGDTCGLHPHITYGANSVKEKK